MAFTDAQLTNMRQELGLAEDADEATIVAALSEALSERAETPASPPSGGQPSAQPAPPSTPSSSVSASVPGTMVIDSSAWDEQQKRIQRLEAQEAKRKREERDDVVAKAINDGKFLASSADHYKRLWDNDPETARAVIDSLKAGVIPTNELGHAGEEESFDDEFGHIFPPSYTPNGA